MNETAILIIFAMILAAIPLVAGALYFRRHKLKIGTGNELHPLLILGIIFLFPGLFSLIMYGEESVFLSMGVVFTISGTVAQFLLQVPPEDQARRYSLTGSLLGFALGAAIGTALSLVFGWPPILLIVVVGALGLLAGTLFARSYRKDINT